MSPLTICIIIFVISLILYALNIVPMSVTAVGTMMALVMTGCLQPATALSGFSNTNTIIMVGMFVIAAGFSRTRFVDKLSAAIVKLAGGSFQRAYFGYIIMAALLTNLLSSPMVVFAIVFPLCSSMCKEFDVSPSKTMFPLVVICIGCCGILPFATAATSAAQFNGYLETYNMTQYVVTALDFAKARLPMMILLLLWAYFIAPKFAPDHPIVPISGDTGGSKKEKTPLKPFAEAMGYMIFFAAIVLFIFGDKIGIGSWQVCVIGAVMVVVCGVLDEREAIASMPTSMALIYIGSLAMGNALNETGAGTVIGNLLNNAVGGSQNNYLLGALFFVIPFLVTQFMLNRAVVGIFVPICLIFCQTTGANPVGLMILVNSACLTAFMTPMATPAIPMAMGAGGYDIRSLLKQSWLISIVLSLAYVAWIMTVYPAF